MEWILRRCARFRSACTVCWSALWYESSIWKQRRRPGHMEDSYHKADQQTVQALRNLAHRLTRSGLAWHHLQANTSQHEWQAVIVDGHSVEELCKDKLGWHGKPLPKDLAESVVKELQGRMVSSSKRLYPAPPCEDAPPVSLRNIRMPSAPSYKLGEKVATRKAYGMALAKLGRYNQHVIVLDGDTKNSTFAELFKNEHPDRYVECYIAEQNMLRMAAISESNINLCGSHCGVSIGEDGPSQMGLEDLAMFRAIPTATVFYPSDAVSTEKAVELAANTKGLCFIRTSRPENSVIYNSNEDFHVGQAKVVYKTNDDHVTVIGAGVTLHEAMAAAEQLKKERINIRVIDPFTIKPLDSKTIIDNARATRGRIITDAPPVSLRNIRMPSAPSYKLGEKVATRKAYGMALAKLGRYNQHVIVLDGDTKNSTFAELFKNEHPDRYVECYIAEQNMDGPSQMGLEDLAMFRAIPTATVFYPSDAVSTEKAVELAANTKGLCFIRTSRPENSVIYNSNEDFHVGQAKVVYKTNDDHVTVIGAGVTLHEAMAAAEQLKKERINIRVIDPFTIKPLDSKTIIDNARATRGRIITVEDHYYEGGLGEAVCAAVVNEAGFSVNRMAVAAVPRSGKPQELLRIFGIDREAIAQAVRKILSSAANNK
ncbi:hypothetical protein CRUP_009709 [Coryphaenoides rupestris]|nr:hypothetical protein CRUP_009709 [Coryphaenoides rupestris]